MAWPPLMVNRAPKAAPMESASAPLMRTIIRAPAPTALLIAAIVCPVCIAAIIPQPPPQANLEFFIER
jgi:hypothetical protein